VGVTTPREVEYAFQTLNEEARRSARITDRAAEQRNKLFFADVIQHRGNLRPGIGRQRRNFPGQNKMTASLRRDEAKWTLLHRTRSLGIAGWCRRVVAYEEAGFVG